MTSRHRPSGVAGTVAGAPMLARLHDAYRRTGADLPFGDPARAHGVAMEGYYWRIVQPQTGSVVVALCGACRTDRRRWAVVALAAHPGGHVAHAVVESHATDARRFGVRASTVLEGDARHLRVQLPDEGWLRADLRPRVGRPGRAFGALGPAHALPGLPQYWHPVVLAADAGGEARLGGTAFDLEGARAYLEKNWGGGFAGDWWWGHADAFDGEDASVAFAGGAVRLAGVRARPTAVVVRLGREIVSLASPLAAVTARATDSEWEISARRPGWSVRLEAAADASSAHLLPVPDVRTGRVEMRSRQHLAGRLRLIVRRRGRTVFDGASSLAGLERGRP